MSIVKQLDNDIYTFLERQPTRFKIALGLFPNLGKKYVKRYIQTKLTAINFQITDSIYSPLTPNIFIAYDREKRCFYFLDFNTSGMVYYYHQIRNAEFFIIDKKTQQKISISRAFMGYMVGSVLSSKELTRLLMAGGAAYSPSNVEIAKGLMMVTTKDNVYQLSISRRGIEEGMRWTQLFKL